MKDDQFSRREALNRLSRIIGLAAGLGTPQIRTLLAQTKSVNFERLAKAQAVSAATKSLKTLVIGTREIYVSEFGRNPMLGGSGELGVISRCSDFFSPAPSSVRSSSCGKNSCGDQKCELSKCEDNDCTKQNCTTLECPNVKDIGSPVFLRQHKSDPFIQALFQEFNVTTAEQLSHQLIDFMGTRR